jgi:CMP-N-acetylneuraminic acid synthetase
MKTIAIIPARGGSKRLPNKNVLSLGEIPLIAHSILFAKKNNTIIDDIYVSTDNEIIKNIALQYGAKVIDRPDKLSGDLQPTVTALKHVLENLDLMPENIVLLQPTNPFREKNLLEKCFEVYIEKNADSLFTVSKNNHKLGKIHNNCYVPFNYKIGQRSQDLEPLYFENGLLYICKSKLILEEKIISETAFPFVVNHIFANIDIDTQEDFDYAAYIHQKFINQLS